MITNMSRRTPAMASVQSPGCDSWRSMIKSNTPVRLYSTRTATKPRIDAGKIRAINQSIKPATHLRNRKGMGCEFEETALRANRAYNVIPTTAKARDRGGAPPRNEWSPLDQFALI